MATTPRARRTRASGTGATGTGGTGTGGTTANETEGRRAQRPNATNATTAVATTATINTNNATTTTEATWMQNFASVLASAPPGVQQMLAAFGQQQGTAGGATQAAAATATPSPAGTATQTPQRRGVRIMTPQEQAAAMMGLPTEDEDDLPPTEEDASETEAEQTQRELPPRTKTEPMLATAMKQVALDQSEDADITADMAIQGKERPSSTATFKDWAVHNSEPTTFCAMIPGSPFVQPVHAIFKYNAPARSRDAHNNKIVAAFGDRDGTADPPFMMLKPTFFSS